jgi:23S rRNA (cytidine2498-2'-O)-methyltransferase
MSPSTFFFFATCNIGSEASLKAEVARSHGQILTPAFMRPGLITWKSKTELPLDFELKSVFARASGFSHGLCKTPEDVSSLVQKIETHPLHLHLFTRVPPEAELADQERARIAALHASTFSSLTEKGVALQREGPPALGEWILDLVVEPDSEHCLAGFHQHTLDRHTSPGGLPQIDQPYEAPSRAFLKMEQALAWQNLTSGKTLTGLTALELGCAPGGASYSLLNHGIHVIGIDTGAMDDRVLNYRGPDGAIFTHLRTTAGAVSSQDLPQKIDMLVSDMNLAPPIVLKYVEALQRRIRAKILIITLKLNDRSLEEKIPLYLKHFAQFAPGRVSATQLAANRREICLFSRA